MLNFGSNGNTGGIAGLPSSTAGPLAGLGLSQFTGQGLASAVGSASSPEIPASFDQTAFQRMYGSRPGAVAEQEGIPYLVGAYGNPQIRLISGTQAEDLQDHWTLKDGNLFIPYEERLVDHDFTRQFEGGNYDKRYFDPANLPGAEDLVPIAGKANVSWSLPQDGPGPSSQELKDQAARNEEFRFNNGGLIRRGNRERGYAEGGEVTQEGGPSSQDLQDSQMIEQALIAIDPSSPMTDGQRQEILVAFQEAFGPDAISELEAMFQEEISGAGSAESDGLSDSIPAIVNGEEPVRLSEGEFIVPADVVSSLGNGSTEAGSRQLMNMVEELRMAKGGSSAQPGPVDPRGIMAALGGQGV